MSVDPDSVPARADGIIVQETKGQTVLLRPEDGSYYAIEEVGARIWQLCDGATTVRGIAETLCAEYDADPEVVRADVIAFVAELRAEQLLESAG